MKRLISTIYFLMLMFAFQTVTAKAQVYPVTIQGSLKDGAVPANGSYDVECSFFSLPVGGASVATRNFNATQVTNGIFTLTGDFGQIFSSPSIDQWVEFHVKPAGAPGPFTILAPRQRVAFAPLAVSAISAENASTLGGLLPAQLVQATDPRMTDARNPLPGSDNYIRNLPVGQGQSSANFSVTGIGKASVLDADEFRVFNNRILAGTTNGTNNLLVGIYANLANGGGSNNSFIGYNAGRNHTTGSGNTYTGSQAGSNNGSGSNNSYFGSGAGQTAIDGNFNSFFGHRSGEFTRGDLNSFFGTGAGSQNNLGSSNSFFGHDAGNRNFSGTLNTAIGENADFSAIDLTNATAVGSKAFVAQSNSLVLGSINGVNGATADTNVGIGTTTPANKLHVNGNVRVTNGAIYITNPNTLVITSPNGACWGITVNNSGGLATFPIVPCP